MVWVLFLRSWRYVDTRLCKMREEYLHCKTGNFRWSNTFGVGKKQTVRWRKNFGITQKPRTSEFCTTILGRVLFKVLRCDTRINENKTLPKFSHFTVSQFHLETYYEAKPNEQVV